MEYKYLTRGTCSREIDFEIEDNIIKNIKFYGGCPGNLEAIAKAMEGKTVEEIESLFKDIKCGNKPTSCSAELAKAVRKAYEESKK
ncbi:MAG: TIGR03905 family TSCPD domain-containing protein [Clostridiales bacterium]|nr:TIGR03905 family TSCPD domain-containing protein [Clostridiales bacterium]